MIITKINGKEVKLKKTDVIKILSEGKREEVMGTLEVLMQVEELKKVKGYSDNCEFSYIKIEEDQPKIVYEQSLKKIKTIIENHGIPGKGHLDDYATRILKKLDSPAYAALMDNEDVAISYGKVRAHLHENKHEKKYEAHLHRLYEIICREEKSMELSKKRTQRLDIS